MLRSFLLAFAAVLISAGCASSPPAPSIKADFNPETDFRLFKTYRWFDGPFFEGDPATADEKRYRDLRDAMNRELRLKKYDWQQFAATDLVCHIHSGLQNSTRVQNWMTYNWYAPWWGAFGPRVEVSVYDPGTLVLDIIDAKRTALVWRGLLPGFFTADGAVSNPEAVEGDFAKVLNSFPEAVR